MIKKHYRVLLSVTLLLLSAYFLYRWYASSRDISPWTMIPANAILVYETAQAGQTWEQVQKEPFWAAGKAMAFQQQLQEDIKLLDSILVSHAGKADAFAQQPFLTSMHLVGPQDVQFLFYIDVRDQEVRQLFEKVLADFKQQARFWVKERIFQGVIITEVGEGIKGRVLSFIQHKNIIVAGFAPVLIEDIIRRKDSGLHLSFIEANPFVKTLSAGAGDQGSVYFNYAPFSAVLKSMAMQKPFLPAVFADVASLDLSIKEDKLLLKGISREAGEDDYLHIFKDQAPGSAYLLAQVPTHTAMLYHLSFSESESFFNAYSTFRKYAREPFQQKASAFFEKYQIDSAALYKWIEQEVALCVLESANAARPEQMLLLRSSQPKEALNLLNRISRATAQKDSIFSEKVGLFTINSIEVKDFPALLLGSPFAGFNKCFYAVTDSTVILTNHLSTIRSYLTALETGQRAGKVMRNADWNGNAVGNVNLMVSTASIWNILLQQTSPSWRKFLKENEQALKKTASISVQFSHHKDNTFLSSVSVHLQKAKPATAQTQHLLVKTKAEVPYRITSKPFIVRNGEDRSAEMIFQDEAHMLYLLNKEGKVMFRHPVHSPLAGEVEQVDLHKDGKLQYFFATKKNIYLLDRFGALINNFPVRMPDTVSIQHATVLDYDKNKNYRFLVTNRAGDMYIFDQHGQNLEGWKPRRIGHKPATAPFHLRIREKDCIVSLQQNGMLHVLRRNGEAYPGFPVQMEGRFESQLFVEYGVGFEDTYLTSISREGLLYTINLNGKIIKKMQAYRPAPEAVFSLSPDATGKNFIIVLQHKGKVSIMDPQFNKLFDKTFAAATLLPVQYYNFGAGKEIIVITDKQRGQTFVFDRAGRMQDFKTIKSSHEVGLIYSEAADLYFLYRSHGREAGVVTFRWN